MLSVTGTPYDTIHGVIGISGEGMGSLKDFGIVYKQVELNSEGRPDLQAIKEALEMKPRMVYIQRSKGYTLRPSLSVAEIGEIAALVHEKALSSSALTEPPLRASARRSAAQTA